jgi:pyruvate dehydrogenase E2 component (dihydrolipoamide acetyltransferase)
MKELTMPQIALGADEVTARGWLIALDEPFKRGQPILEIETDKATMEVEAPFDGVLLSQLCADGEIVTVGATIGQAAEPGEDLDAARASLESGGAPQPPASDADVATGRPPAAAPVAARAPSDGDIGSPPVFVQVQDGELAGLFATAPARDGVATRSAQASPALLDDPVKAGPSTLRPLSRARVAIGRRTGVATAIPCFWVARDVDWAPAREAVARARASGASVTITEVVLKATAAAGLAYPNVNAWYGEDGIREFGNVNIALAVDSPNGVIAPVLPAVQELELAEIAGARAKAVTAAREGSLPGQELTGATITVSNVGGLGAHAIMPVLTAPQVAAIGVGAPRPMSGSELLTIVFVGDHRALDGADGARFLASLADNLTDVDG